MTTRQCLDGPENEENSISRQLTKAERINALSSATMACAAVLGLMVGLYYNLKGTNTKLFDIFIFESMFIVVIISIIVWLIFHMQEDN